MLLFHPDGLIKRQHLLRGLGGADSQEFKKNYQRIGDLESVVVSMKKRQVSKKCLAICLLET